MRRHKCNYATEFTLGDIIKLSGTGTVKDLITEATIQMMRRGVRIDDGVVRFGGNCVDTVNIRHTPNGVGVEVYVIVTLAECQSCGALWAFSLNDWLEYKSELWPGDTVPAGKCPECNEYCYPEVKNEPYQYDCRGSSAS